MPLTPRPPREGESIDVVRVGPERGLGGQLAAALQTPQFSITVRATAEAVVEDVLQGPGPECIVLDDSDTTVDALALASRLSDCDPDLPVVLCSTDATAYGPQEVLDAGVDELLTQDDLTAQDEVRETVAALGVRYRRQRQDRQDASLLETMLDQLPVHIFAKDDALRYVRASSGLHDSSAMLGDTDAEILPERQEGDESERRVVEDGVAIRNQAEFCPVEDGWFLVSKVPWYDGNDRIGLAGLAIDITDRKQREEELQATTELLSTIVHTSPAAIVVHDTEGTVQFWNPAAADLFGWSPEEAIREPYPPYVTDETREEFHSLVDAVLESGSIGPLEVQRQAKDGEWLDLQLAAETLDDGDGEPSRIVSVLTDVTELKERERRLKRQNDRIEQFTRVLAHDLRNPVQVIQGQLDRAEAFDPALVERALARIEAIVDDVLSVARADPLVTETTDVQLGVVARDVWQHLETADATLRVDEDCPLQANRARLHRLLAHLFENAIEYGGETVTITVGSLDDGFYVADDGAGISDADRDHVFEPGYTTEPGATGFGLNVVREITEAHGWSIELAESATGARFEVHGVTRAPTID